MAASVAEANNPRSTRRYDAFYDGYVCAITALIRNGDEQSAKELMGGAGPVTKDRTDPIDWEILKNAGFVQDNEPWTDEQKQALDKVVDTMQNIVPQVSREKMLAYLASKIK